MTEFLISNKWLIIGISEPIAWIFLGFMGYYRYWNVSKWKFNVSTFLSVFLGYVPHIGIPVLIWVKEKIFQQVFSAFFQCTSQHFENFFYIGTTCVTKSGLRDLIKSEGGTFVFIGFIGIILILGLTILHKYVEKIDDYFKKTANNYKNKIKTKKEAELNS